MTALGELLLLGTLIVAVFGGAGFLLIDRRPGVVMPRAVARKRGP